jgi:PKD repeat protein
VVQTEPGSVSADIVGGMGFDGTDNLTNGELVGFLIAPPDSDGHIGGAGGQYFVQMINLLTTVFDRDGAVVEPPFASNVIWAGIGGNCEAYNQGDPIVLYDEQADRWLFSQFAFPDNLGSFSQCVAISQTDDPTGSYNRYEFSFTGLGMNDYPKHGIVSDSITLMANLFTKRGSQFWYGGTWLAVLNKAAMYAGQTATMRGFNIGTAQFGFVAGDLDGPGSAEALFGTAMSTANTFDIWRITPNWGGSSASVVKIAAIPVTPFDRTLCSASRGACIPQPEGGPALESLSDRLMHRLQIRDFGTYRTMLAAHTVDVNGTGIAGIRWYEFRQPTGGNWSLYQEGTYAPDDGQYRWMPSIAMNGRGDIGVGFLLGGPATYMSVAATGQSAAASGSGAFDAVELACVDGGGVQEGVARSGDYSSTSIDPADDTTFWHTNEYVKFGGNFIWDTYVCPFTIGDGGGGNTPPSAAIATPVCNALSCSFDGSGSTDGDGTIAGYAWAFGDGGTGTGATANHTYAADGTYTVTLTVTDDDDATDTATTQVTVDDGVNVPPNALITSISCTGLDCTYDASGTNDPDGSIASYAWDFGDLTSGSGVTATHSYATAGGYTVTLTVIDNGGASDQATEAITVTEPVDPVSMAVAAITVDSVNAGGGRRAPRARVTIHDDLGNAVAGAQVTGDFTGTVSETGVIGVTGADGIATLVSSKSLKVKLKITFCVTDVSGTLTYVAGDNVVNCASN